MSFELPHGKGGEPSPIPVEEPMSTSPQPKAESVRLRAADDESSRYDILDHLLRSFEQWGQGVQLRLQRQDEQSGLLERQLTQAKMELRGEAQEKEVRLRSGSKLTKMSSKTTGSGST